MQIASNNYLFIKIKYLKVQLVKELQDINQVLREKDKMKEDVIANLSDKQIMLSGKLDAIEKINR